MKIFKILLVNILIIFLLIFSIEIIFGYWFDKDNLGPYMREHRMKKNAYTLKYEENIYKYFYKRNYYGFRGDDIEPKKIKAVMIGGSTTDERYKPEDKTIVGYLNDNILTNNIDLKIINAGIEGQSTLGHIYNFEVWFPKLKDFSPEYFIFYIGINDQYSNKLKTGNGHVKNPSKLENIKDNVKSRSITYDLLRKIKHKYYTKEKRITYDFNFAIKNFQKDKKYKFLNHQQAINKFNIKDLIKSNQVLIKNYLNNVDRLVYYSTLMNAKPIFVNQLTYEGNYNKKLFILNYSLINHCKKKKYFCIDMAKSLQGEKDFWWDGIHTTPKGSKVIADIIFSDLYKIIRNN